MTAYIIALVAALAVGWWARGRHDRSGGRHLLDLDPTRLPPLRQGDRPNGGPTIRLVDGEVESQAGLLLGLAARDRRATDG